LKTFDFMEAPISHQLKDPHSKALEPDCLSPPLAIMTQSQWAEGKGEGEFACLPCTMLGSGPAPPSVETACLPVGRGLVGRDFEI
jgi:hypothetical protein